MCKINWEERIFAVAKDLYVSERTVDYQRIFDEAVAFVNAYKDAFNYEQTEKKPKKDVEPEAWKEAFGVYLELVEDAKNKLLADADTKSAKEKYYPNIDYAMTLDKMVSEFWGTPEGWKYKKSHSKKTAKIDMVATLKKGFDLSHNRVYKRAGAPLQTTQYKPKATSLDKGLVKPQDGTNPDGTFNKNGFRYYHSVRDNLDYSIPLNAPPMPSFECEYDPLDKKWYNPNDLVNGELW